MDKIEKLNRIRDLAYGIRATYGAAGLVDLRQSSQEIIDIATKLIDELGGQIA